MMCAEAQRQSVMKREMDCEIFSAIPTGTFPPFTRPTETPAPPMPTYPTCDKATVMADIILAFDSSLTMDPDVYVDVSFCHAKTLTYVS